MSSHALGFEEIHHTQLALVGGKAANLGELSRIEGLRATSRLLHHDRRLQRMMAQARPMGDRLGRLSRLKLAVCVRTVSHAPPETTVKHRRLRRHVDAY